MNVAYAINLIVHIYYIVYSTVGRTLSSDLDLAAIGDVRLFVPQIIFLINYY
jgi:hypothetical protein